MGKRIHFFGVFCFFLAGCISPNSTSPSSTSPSSTSLSSVSPDSPSSSPSSRDSLRGSLSSASSNIEELLGLYDIFNSSDMKTLQHGIVKEGNYYWGTIEVAEGGRAHFYVDAQFEDSHVYQSSVSEALPAFGTVPQSGKLSHIYFYTPKKSGYLFSGSLCKGMGMTSLLPQHYAERFARVRFVKR